MRVRFTRPALNDLARISASIERENPQAAPRVLTRIEEFADFLSDVPTAGYPVSDGRARTCAIPNMPYRLFFRTVRSELQVLRVRHVRQRPLRFS